MLPLLTPCESGRLQALCDIHDNVSETMTHLHMSTKGHDSSEEELELAPGRTVWYGRSLHRRQELVHDAVACVHKPFTVSYRVSFPHIIHLSQLLMWEQRWRRLMTDNRLVAVNTEGIPRV